MPLFAFEDHEPLLGKGCWIAESATVIGRVELGDDVSVWFNAVLRGDNDLIKVGNRTNLQEGVMVHTDEGLVCTVGDSCTIGHHAILHGCSIGDGSLIGMGATVLNGAAIGKGSLVGANALVPEGSQFPDHSLIVGIPAKVVKRLEPDIVARLQASADGYAQKAHRFAQGLRRLDE